MATQIQIQANRRSAQLSTGSRTEPRKAISRINALKTGIDARNEAASGEDPAALAGLAAEYDHEIQPLRVVERLIVDTLLKDDWFLRRYRFLAADLVNHGAPFGFVGDGGAVVDEVGGEEAVAAQEPVVFNEDVDEEAFDDAEGLELVVVLGGESGENGGVLAGSGFVSGVDAGFGSVHARHGFALLGARAGGDVCTAAIGLNLYLGCHRASASPTVAGEQVRFRGVGWEVIERKRRNRKMLE